MLLNFNNIKRNIYKSFHYKISRYESGTFAFINYSPSSFWFHIRRPCIGLWFWTKSIQTKNAAYFIFIISAIGTGIAYLTGEGAEDTVEKIQGVSENMIEIHEDAAMYALISLIALGIMSVIALMVSRFRTSLIRATSIITLALSLISFGLVARTGYFGGQIRHTEISAATSSKQRRRCRSRK